MLNRLNDLEDIPKRLKEDPKYLSARQDSNGQVEDDFNVEEETKSNQASSLV